ncbi:MAG: hypothetical protein KAW12_01635, partial [Candidatus Aminicenantes bacterium]|nr:hypothetical protein [Candidatus Aminicenantes bacterium]
FQLAENGLKRSPVIYSAHPVFAAKQIFASGGQNPFEKGFWTPKTFDERYASLHNKRPSLAPAAKRLIGWGRSPLPGATPKTFDKRYAFLPWKRPL